MNPKPFQTMEEIRAYVAGDRIQCLLCRKHFRRLGKHLKVHDMTADDYREAFGIPWLCSLTSRPSREASGRAMTPERIAAFKLCRKVRGHKPRPRAPAIRNWWAATAERGRTNSNRRVTTGCATCGTAIETTALCAAQPIHCEQCASPQSLRTRAYYRRKKQRQNQDGLL